MDPKDLRLNAHRTLVGHPIKPAWEAMQDVADWLRTHSIRSGDVYGEGQVINDFETEVAKLLGKEAGVFLPSGTMAQQIAARIWCDRAGVQALGMHSTSHIELHEQRGYAWLHGLKGVMVGERFRPVTAEHLAATKDRLGALVAELPQREIGGVLPTWEELAGLKAAAKDRGMALHLDGARLWETAPYFGHSYAEITAGFSSVYVSFYKILEGMTGAMLLGDADFIAEARVWIRRHGGNLYQQLPYVVSAKLGLDRHLPRIPEYVREAKRIAGVLKEIPGVTFRPDPPHVNMMHVTIAAPMAAVRTARDQIAHDEKVWLFGSTGEGEGPGTTKIEMTFGAGASRLGDAEVAAFFRRVVRTGA